MDRKTEKNSYLTRFPRFYLIQPEFICTFYFLYFSDHPLFEAILPNFHNLNGFYPTALGKTDFIRLYPILFDSPLLNSIYLTFLYSILLHNFYNDYKLF